MSNLINLPTNEDEVRTLIQQISLRLIKYPDQPKLRAFRDKLYKSPLLNKALNE